MLGQLRAHYLLHQPILLCPSVVCVVVLGEAVMAVMVIVCALVLLKADQLHF
jgi:hypothetical protein